MWKSSLLSQKLMYTLDWCLKVSKLHFPFWDNYFCWCFWSWNCNLCTNNRQTGEQNADVWYDSVWDHFMMGIHHYCNTFHSWAVKLGEDQVNQELLRKCRTRRIFSKNAEQALTEGYCSTTERCFQTFNTEFSVGFTKSAKKDVELLCWV